MILYSTCRDCGGLLHVTNHDTVHPLCAAKPTRIETWAGEYLARAELDHATEADESALQRLEAAMIEADAKPPMLLKAALAYASWGWPTFPLKTGSKQPATRNGFKDATTDPERIQSWWTKHPTSNIGLPTGHAFDVIDIDVPAGVTSYAQLIVDDLVPDVHGQVATSSGGLHLYIPATGDGNRAGLVPGIDYRGAGGYVVAPPSTLGPPGRSWSWITKPSPTLTGAKVVAA